MFGLFYPALNTAWTYSNSSRKSPNNSNRLNTSSQNSPAGNGKLAAGSNAEAMPNQKAKRFCRKAGCPSLVANGYCDAHKQAGYDKWMQHDKNEIYDYRWGLVRKSFLREHPLCADCLEKGIVTAAAEVHHRLKARDYPALRLDSANLMSLCKACHNVRTARGE